MGGDEDVWRFFSCFQNDITYRFHDLCNWAWIFRNEMCAKQIYCNRIQFPKNRSNCYYDGVKITTNSDEIYEECEKGESYQAIVKIATHKKNGKKLYFLENVADKPVSKAVKE